MTQIPLDAVNISPVNNVPLRAPAWLTLAGMGAALLIGSSLLSGCAGPVGGTGASSAVPITESDETEIRKRARLRTTLATRYFEEGQDTVALDETKQALAADAEYSPAYVLRGLVYMRMNNPQLAEESFRRALQITPNDPDALHNYGWLLCGLQREKEGVALLARAVANPTYKGQSKSLMTKGVCEVRAGMVKEAEASFARSYQLDSTNPISGYNLASLLFKRGENERAQFYIRRLNATELANAETLWLGIKIERQMKNQEVADQLAQQLQRRFPESEELKAYRRGAFYE